MARASASPTRPGPEGSNRNESRLGRCPASHPYLLSKLNCRTEGVRHLDNLGIEEAFNHLLGVSQGSTRSYGQLFLIFKISDESEDVMLADPENEALHIRTSIYMGLQSGCLVDACRDDILERLLGFSC